ncbi:MAG TPA: hypothetical protein VEL70_01245, partial [Candidatus Acidoferrum sp.]|nr:hypothetical protein [Candidatus Acidoferrum sp.]
MRTMSDAIQFTGWPKPENRPCTISKSPWKPYGNPIGTNSYDTHIIMRTNCIVFLSFYDNFRHYCKI